MSCVALEIPGKAVFEERNGICVAKVVIQLHHDSRVLFCSALGSLHLKSRS